MDETQVVTAFLRNATDVLLARRSGAVGTDQGQWAGISGSAEGDPESQIWVEIREETGLGDADVSFVCAGDPVDVVDGDRHWVVHPYLFDATTREIRPNEELAAVKWVTPTTIRDTEHDTVPGLWDAYDRVRPTVNTIQADREHGSAYLSLRALDVLRDEAALAEDWDAITGTARNLLDARPDMAALQNRVNRAMHEASETNRDPVAVERAAIEVAGEAVSADADAAATAAELVQGQRVATLSRSGTVLESLLEGTPSGVAISESCPLREGVAVAEELADAGLDVTLTSDVNLPNLVGEYDLVLVGADAVNPDGGVVNKVGTRPLALGARAANIPFYVVCAADKITTEPSAPTEQADPETIYEGATTIEIQNPLFDATPPDLVTGIVTADGILEQEDVRDRAEEHRRIAQWE